MESKPNAPLADRRRAAAAPVAARRRTVRWRNALLFTMAATAVIQLSGSAMLRGTLVRAGLGGMMPNATPSLNAFGRSHGVKLRVTLPGDTVEFPLQVGGDPSGISYLWLPLHDAPAVAVAQDAEQGVAQAVPVGEDDAAGGSPVAPDTEARQLTGSVLIAPRDAGFYHLVLVRGAERQVMASPVLAVMVPFSAKIGGMLNGYRIGTYLAERLRSWHARPDGFVQVESGQVDLPVSTHFRLGDFVTHDAQRDVWPKYVALDPRLLDKLELVIANLDSTMRQAGGVRIALDVHSGFRTPVHNAHVPRSAHDSRHEYGDAADVAFDFNGSGRMTIADERIVARAVDAVEREHPDLVGGLGLYTSRRYRTPYVHIDTRGRRSRWRG